MAGYFIDFLDDAVVRVLQSKEWFEWDNQSVPLQEGTALFFRVQSQVTKIKHHIVSVRIGRHIRPQSTETICQGRIGGLLAG